MYVAARELFLCTRVNLQWNLPYPDSPEAGTSVYRAALQKEEINLCYETCALDLEKFMGVELK